MISIAIDGPSGSGKSTVSKIIAKKLKFLSVDTGALYRAVAYFVLKNKIDFSNEEDVKQSIKNLNLDIKNKSGSQHVLIDGEDVTSKLRNKEVTKVASKIAAFPCVREYLLEFQRDISKSNNVVMDGRDIGTVVLPDAEIKIFLTASPKVRARRRLNQLLSKNPGVKFNYGEILKSINKRDYEDSHRKIAPLKRAKDSILFDSSRYSLWVTAKKLLSIIKERVGDL